jgi:acylphosphatase
VGLEAGGVDDTGAKVTSAAVAAAGAMVALASKLADAPSNPIQDYHLAEKHYLEGWAAIHNRPTDWHGQKGYVSALMHFQECASTNPNPDVEPAPERTHVEEEIEAALHLRITGQVTGVGFRSAFRVFADDKFVGCVANTAPGQVDLVVGGSIRTVERLRASCQSATELDYIQLPAAANIENCEPHEVRFSDYLALLQLEPFFILTSAEDPAAEVEADEDAAEPGAAAEGPEVAEVGAPLIEACTSLLSR